jgi:hypothetical protein
MGMTPDELAVKLLAHARWMVESGQFRGAVAEYVGFHEGRGEAWDKARELLEQEENAARAATAQDDGGR